MLNFNKVMYDVDLSVVIADNILSLSSWEYPQKPPKIDEASTHKKKKMKMEDGHSFQPITARETL